MAIATPLLVLAAAGALVAEPPLSAAQGEEPVVVGSRFFESYYGKGDRGYSRGYPRRPPGYLDWPGHRFEYFQRHRRQHPLLDSHRHHRLRRP